MKKNDFVFVYRVKNRIINSYGTCRKCSNGKATIILENGSVITVDIIDTVFEVLI